MKQEEKQKTTYAEKLNGLKEITNGRITPDKVTQFKTIIADLKEDHAERVSVNFVKRFITNADKTKKRRVIFNLLKRAELKTENAHRYFKEFDNYGNTISTKETLRFIIA